MPAFLEPWPIIVETIISVGFCFERRALAILRVKSFTLLPFLTTKTFQPLAWKRFLTSSLKDKSRGPSRVTLLAS